MSEISTKTHLVIASSNSGKVKELQALLSPIGWHVFPQTQWNTPDCPEPHQTFVENALAKARHAARHTKLPALADDSGLCVSALQGAPGVLSARYASIDGGEVKDDLANNQKLLAQLDGVSHRHAYFVCVLVALRHEYDPEPLISIGRWQGSIALQPCGTNGFGYDCIFTCSHLGMTAASMTPAQKNTVSHRAQAFNQLVPVLKQYWL